jgi:glyoxylase-like metal-dependent hydrolase (beta-lactamase superfamily II)
VVVAVLAALAPAQEESPAAWRGMPPVKWQRLSDNLWRIEDGTVAYLVRAGAKALLINIGGGRALRDLSPAEVTQVEGVLVTHHLRPVTQGLPAAVKLGAWIAAPAGEARLLSDAQTFWRETALRDVYIFKPDLDTPADNVAVAKTLQSGKPFTWQGITFEVIDTPGPTAGAVSLVARIDDLPVAFTGELIVEDGKIPNYWNMEYAYGDNGLPGLRATRASVQEVMKRLPAMLLPARGPVISQPKQAADKLLERIAAVEKLFAVEPLKKGVRRNDHPLPHLYWRRGSYLVVGDEGHAVLIGYPGLDARGWGGPRWLGKLYDDHVFTKLDAIFLLGYQDDHVAGAPALAATFGCPVYTSAEVAQALRSDGPDPFTLFRAGQFDAPLQPSIVNTGDKPSAEMEWRGHHLRFVPLGGHSLHQMGILADIDGKQILFTGDTLLPTQPLSGDLNCLCRVEQPGFSYTDAADWLQKLHPALAATNHHGLIELDDARLAGFAQWARAIEPALTPLLATHSYRAGLDPFARHSVTPFHLVMEKPGEKYLRLAVRNDRRGPLAVQYHFHLPAGWLLQARSREDPNVFVETHNAILARRAAVTSWSLDLRLTPPPDLPPGRTVIPIDVVDGSEFLGQILHLIVDCGFQSVAPWRPAGGMTPYAFARERYRNFAWLPDPSRGLQRVLWPRWPE